MNRPTLAERAAVALLAILVLAAAACSDTAAPPEPPALASVVAALDGDVVGPATSLVVVSGNGQHAGPGGIFAAPLVVVATDASARPVPGASVVFTALSSRASVTFGAADPTDEAGRTQVVASAGTASGAVGVSATLVGTSARVTFKLVVDAGPAVALVALSGDGQSAVAAEPFAAPLVVAARDEFGNPVAGASVAFAAPDAAPSALFAPPAATDAAGRTEVSGLAGVVAGAFAATATLVGSDAQVTFALSIVAGPPASVVAVSGNRQSVVVDQPFARPLVARVADRFDNPVAGATVVFSAPDAGPSALLDGPAEPSDSRGETRVAARAGTAVGLYNVSAAVDGASTAARFALTNLVGDARALTLVSGDDQRAVVGQPFASPLVARVDDAFGNPVPGVEVRFTAPGDGPSALVASAVASDVDGLVRVPFTAGHAAGDYALTATIDGAPAVPIRAHNAPGAAVAIRTAVGDGQRVAVGQPFASPLAFEVRDAFDNPVPGVAVAFHAVSAGALASLEPSQATTGDDGRASVAVVAGVVAGPSTVRASASGVATPALASLVTTAGEAARIALVSGDGQAARVATPFAARLVVHVTDAFGNACAGVSVHVAVPPSGATAIAPAAVVTGVDGSASVGAVAARISGDYLGRASIDGAPPVAFHLRNAPGPVSRLVVSPECASQATQVRTPYPLALEVLVADAFGNPIPHVQVAFAGPADGPRASLDATHALSDEAGLAAIHAVAEAQAGSFAVSASVADLAPVTFALTNLAGRPTSVVVVSGTPSSPVVAHDLDAPLEVLVRDADGNPVPGARVVFAAPADGATLTLDAPTPRTDADGRAATRAHAGTVAGSYVVSATVDDAAAPALFDVTNRADRARSMRVDLDGATQRAAVRTPFPLPLGAVVRDAWGNPVPDAVVRWTAPVDGPTARLQDAQSRSDADGHVAIAIAAGDVAGAYVVRAAVDGVEDSAVFVLENLTGPAAALALDGPAKQVATVATAFAEPLAVVLSDALGNPVADAEVHFSGPSADAKAAFDAVARTDSEGRAAVVALAGTVSGRYQVSATAPGAATPVVFSLRNLADRPASLVAVDGAPQATVVGTAFAEPLTVAVRDQFGNGVPAVAVVFAAPPAGPTATLSSTATRSGEDGTAAVTALAGGQRQLPRHRARGRLPRRELRAGQPRGRAARARGRVRRRPGDAGARAVRAADHRRPGRRARQPGGRRARPGRSGCQRLRRRARRAHDRRARARGADAPRRRPHRPAHAHAQRRRRRPGADHRRWRVGHPHYDDARGAERPRRRPAHARRHRPRRRRGASEARSTSWTARSSSARPGSTPTAARRSPCRRRRRAPTPSSRASSRSSRSRRARPRPW
ncbi:MAG: Ig-like domain-containing protein [Myxococcota bacterium]